MDGNKSNHFLRDLSETKISHEERPTFHSQLFNNDKTDSDKDKNNLDYDSVIKQFDELISELSHQRNVKRKIDLSKDLCLENENFVLNCSNSKNENAGNFDKDFSHSIKSFKLKQPSTGTTVPLNDNIVLPTDLESKKHVFKPEHPHVKQYTDIGSSKNILNVNSFLNTKESMPWINSHLWDPKRKAERLFHQKPDLLGNTKVSTPDFKKNFDECYNNDSPKPMMLPVPQNFNTFNTYYLLKQGNTSTDKTTLKCNKMFSCNRITMQEKICHPKLELASASASIPRYPKISRCQASKYILSNNCFLVQLYIETKDLHLGPFMFEVFPKMTLRLLKLKVEQEHGIISTSQRWILGKHFAIDNDKSLADYNVLPGSYIIVYVDTEQNISDNNEKNKNVFHKSTTKYEISGKSLKKWKTGSYDNLSAIDSEIIGLVRKDSLDSKLQDSCLRTDAEFNCDCSNHSLELENAGISIIDKQDKTLTNKAKNMKKGKQNMKRTKVVIHDEKFLSDLNNEKSSYSGLQNNYDWTKHSSDFTNHVHNIKEKSGSSTQIQLFEKMPSESQLIFLNEPQNILTVNSEVSSMQVHEQLNNKNKESNCFEIKDHVQEIESNTNTNFNTNFNYNPNFLKNGYENLKEVAVESENKTDNENQEINLGSVSNKFSAEDPENKTDLNLSFQENFKADSSFISSDEKSKRKQSITSLIRKLSLSHRTRSTDDCPCSEAETSNKIQNSEVKRENDFDFHSQKTNQLVPSDIHIEISSCSTNSPLENEFTEQQTDDNLQSSVIDNDPKSTQNFELLLEIENMDLVQNTFNFTCPVCFDEYESGEGVILHDCLHIFCRDCLTNAVCYADGALVKCPYRDDLYTCQSHLQQREIKALVSEEMYEKYLQRSITTAEGLAERSFHCKTPDCKGWCIYDDAINVFHCPVCLHYNCLNCQAIHEGLNCRQYQDKLKLQQKIDKESEKTLALLNDMINSGKALRCPKCDLILLKKWGCDWLKCTVCKTEICWITKGPRWGPGGQGDTSGGCKCGVNGVKCHPSCTYCH